jgi:hypothetical protein
VDLHRDRDLGGARPPRLRPEIRLRLFWEQIARIAFALGFFGLGAGSLGLVLAHLCSLALTALLCVPLLARYYEPRRLLRARVSAADLRLLLTTGLALLPSNAARRFLIDGPAMIINMLLPGARGAVASGLFEIARKLATLPLAVRQAFQYVMAPLAAHQARADRARIAPLYRFASRLSTALVVPLAGWLAFAGPDILSIYRPEVGALCPALHPRRRPGGRGDRRPRHPDRRDDRPPHPAPGQQLRRGRQLGGLSIWLVPLYGAPGMAIAVGVATVAIAYMATLELQLTERLSPFDRKLFLGLGVALAGVGLMALAAKHSRGPVRFASVTFCGRWRAGARSASAWSAATARPSAPWRARFGWCRPAQSPKSAALPSQGNAPILAGRARPQAPRRLRIWKEP